MFVIFLQKFWTLVKIGRERGLPRNWSEATAEQCLALGVERLFTRFYFTRIPPPLKQVVQQTGKSDRALTTLFLAALENFDDRHFLKSWVCGDNAFIFHHQPRKRCIWSNCTQQHMFMYLCLPKKRMYTLTGFEPRFFVLQAVAMKYMYVHMYSHRDGTRSREKSFFSPRNSELALLVLRFRCT
jgi:hypothetical protein